MNFFKKVKDIRVNKNLRDLRDKFKLIEKAFSRKGAKSSVPYPFDIIDQYKVFGDNFADNRISLVGENWLDQRDIKPVAILWGFNDWKWGFVSKYLKDYRVAYMPRKIGIINSLFLLSRFPLKPEAFIFWGYTEPRFLNFYAHSMGVKVFRMEDGFVRSSLLGASHSTPYSLVLDARGMYYNPREISDIEVILNNKEFSKDKLKAARECLDLMNGFKITKYNEPNIKDFQSKKIKSRKRVAVLGQVDKDMSLKLGNVNGYSLVDLIKLAKYENYDADIIYRPHPEVYKGYQKNRTNRRQIEKYCEISSPEIPLYDFLESVDHIYTITSLSGLEALFMGKKVTVVGAPFYAGWGLTDDRCNLPRRTKKRNVEELFCAVYLDYPIYLANLDNKVIGFKSAVFRIIADREIEESKLIKNHISSDSENSSCRRKFWLEYFFRHHKDEYFKYDDILNINFSKWLISYSERIFQVAFLYSILGKIDDNDNREVFLNKVRRYTDKSVFNQCLIDLDKYYPGTYIHKQTSLLLNEVDDKHSSLMVLRSGFDFDANVSCDKNYDEIWINRDVFDLSKIDIKNSSHQSLIFSIFLLCYERKEFEKALYCSRFLLLANYQSLKVLLILAEISELKFEIQSAKGLSKLCRKIDFFAENRKSLSLEINSFSEADGIEEKKHLLKLLAIELVVNPERINNSIFFGKNKLKEHDFIDSARGVVELDNEYTINKAMAYLELGKPEYSLYILQKISESKLISDKFFVVFSKTLCALGRYPDALKIISRIFEEQPSDANVREFIRVLVHLGEFQEALKVAEKAKERKLDVSSAVLIPVYLGLGKIYEAYRCYLDVPFRKEMINFFNERYKKEDDIVCDDLLLLSVYGPGDEIRFASIYNDILKKNANKKIRFTCDYRLLSIFKRSYPEVEFLPVKRSRLFSDSYPRSLFDKLPSSELRVVLDNDGYDFVTKSSKIVMVTDLISEYRRERSNFPGLSYLKTNDELFNLYKKRFNPNLKYIGINWRSSLTNFSRNDHYLTVEDLSDVWSLDGVQFVNFQYDDCEAELNWINQKYPGKIINFEDIDHFNDFEKVAALMKCVDIVVAPCTTVAELSGAIGCKTWLLSNSYEIHWRRYGANNCDIWHNSMIHIEGDNVGCKSDLVKNLCEKIKKYVSEGV